MQTKTVEYTGCLTFSPADSISPPVSVQDYSSLRRKTRDPGPPDVVSWIRANQTSSMTAVLEKREALLTRDDEAEQNPEGTATESSPGFRELGLSDPVLRAVHEIGYRTPTPIQAQAIPFILMGRDVLGTAQTGTGKTAGFTLPMLDILAGSRARARMPRSLILEPTRELALQVAENFQNYGRHLKLSHVLIIGGESLADQKEALLRGADVLIATPGRLLDIFDRGGILLSDTRVLVIDEADRMLDMGFIPDVERIVSLLPKTRQTLFFSATMAAEIRKIADRFLQNPKEVSVSPPASIATTIREALVLVDEHDKREALRRLIRSEGVQNALIFCNRKRDVDILCKSLTRHRFAAGALHGDMPQSTRFATLDRFKSGQTQLLVCSDVAARGIDIGGLSHVFNFDVPHHPEDYIHRIGRTGRAGLEGHAYTIAAPNERGAVSAIEALIGKLIPRVALDGLDPVEWAERDTSKRRGRGTSARGGTSVKHAGNVGQERAKASGSRSSRSNLPKATATRTSEPRSRDAVQQGFPVFGFGADTPAFMMTSRHARKAARRQSSEQVQQDITKQGGGSRA
ncbi:MAG: DEAD/DEAH box helicase [Acidobacteriaceae bacterium]|nr:DEAD/DEAH box helicase [Acidobacteriaceae bacterium]